MRRTTRAQSLADWTTLIGGLALFVSLFLTWSHQLPPSVLDTFAGSAAIRGVPANPTAWQVYSVADVLLALLAVGLAAVALRGRSRGARITALAGVGVALAFVAHANAVAPTNGLLLIDPSDPSAYLAHAARPGAGEMVAIIALGLAAAGLALALTLDLSSGRVRHQRR